MTPVKKKDALLDFIETYKNLPELWNLECPAYSNRLKKVAAYDVLVEKLKILEPEATRDTVVKKINNIRSAFRKELKKVNESKRSGIDSDGIYVPSLWYFDKLMFLVKQEKPEPRESTVDDDTYADSVSLPASPSGSISSGQTPTYKLVRSSKKRKMTPVLHSLLAKATQHLEAEDDECLTLAKSYAVKMRRLTSQQLIFADKVINQTLFDAQMGLLTRNSYVVHSLRIPSVDTSQSRTPSTLCSNNETVHI